MISCLMVTQASHINTVGWAIYDFVRQSHLDKELIVLHDGKHDYHQYLAELIGHYPNSSITLVQESANYCLGELRNLSLELANGEYICQWDDDDRYHSARLEIQYSKMRQQDADFCFLTDQLHLFLDSKTLFWDDWNIESYPMNLIQGSIMARKALMPSYPSLDKGEDTPVIIEIAKSNTKIATLADKGYLYLYQYTGKNTWNAMHHCKISLLKQVGRAKIEENLEEIRNSLIDYGEDSFGFPLSDITMPTQGGAIRLFDES